MLRNSGLLLALCTLLFASCMEDSKVVKISKDGSGILQERDFRRTWDEEKDVEMPNAEELLEKAASLGPDVTVTSAKISQNPRGWFGYEIVYAFPDINDLVIHASGKQNAEKPQDDLIVRFHMENGQLEANFENPLWTAAKAKPITGTDGPTIDPYADAPGPRAEGLKISLGPSIDPQSDEWKRMTRGMRKGIFIQIDGALKETNASFQRGELYSLMDFDLGKMNESGELENFDQLSPASREGMQQLVEELDGFQVDLQQPVRFVFE
ncbi:hypothetical protein HNR46_003742 [Haloferula luteola]|uniref:Lipoprotein n=1 Tax=Haloferula luteola TaxID=595692 RepID=A0A840VLH7_9BACT|nr:hypothetical protein [Haloferula luteola]MBB5353481.1 hypothetical protein [Haloferula luteola]